MSRQRTRSASGCTCEERAVVSRCGSGSYERVSMLLCCNAGRDDRGIHLRECFSHGIDEAQQASTALSSR